VPEVPNTQYAKSGDLHIAYQVVGEGPFDLIYAPGFISHVEMNWESPYWANVLGRMSRFCRVIIFDKRGTGLSDRVGGWPTLEERMDDIRAVMDAAGSERAVLHGISEGGPMSMVFAALYPERTAALNIAPQRPTGASLAVVAACPQPCAMQVTPCR
jgi:pimeloyl-ACP methyl ester carboxylesterase